MKKFIAFFIFIGTIFATEITVYGENEIALAPNSVVVNLQLMSNGDSLSDAKAKNDEISAKLNKLLADNNVSKDNAKITNTNFYTNDSYDNNGKIVGKNYTAAKFITLNLEKNSDEILNSIIDMGISYADISYKNSQISAHEQKSLESSLNSAISKAKSLAKSMNKEVDSIASVEEIPPENLFFGTRASSVDNPVILVKTKVKIKVLLKDE